MIELLENLLKSGKGRAFGVTQSSWSANGPWRLKVGMEPCTRRAPLGDTAERRSALRRCWPAGPVQPLASLGEELP